MVVLVQLVRHWWNQEAPRVYHGLSYKTNMSAMSTSYSQATRLTSVGSPELVGANLGLHTHYEAGFWMGLEFGHYPVDVSSSLQRRSRVSEVYMKKSRNILESILESWLDVKSD